MELRKIHKSPISKTRIKTNTWSMWTFSTTITCLPPNSSMSSIYGIHFNHSPYVICHTTYDFTLMLAEWVFILRHNISISATTITPCDTPLILQVLTIQSQWYITHTGSSISCGTYLNNEEALKLYFHAHVRWYNSYGNIWQQSTWKWCASTNGWFVLVKLVLPLVGPQCPHFFGHALVQIQIQCI